MQSVVCKVITIYLLHCSAHSNVKCHLRYSVWKHLVNEMYYSYSRNKYHPEEWRTFEWINNIPVLQGKMSGEREMHSKFSYHYFNWKYMLASVKITFLEKVLQMEYIYTYKYINICMHLYMYLQFLTCRFKQDVSKIRKKLACNQLGNGYTGLKKFNNSFWKEFPRKLML